LDSWLKKNESFTLKCHYWNARNYNLCNYLKLWQENLDVNYIHGAQSFKILLGKGGANGVGSSFDRLCCFTLKFQ
jgi:hypothetical protein